MRVRTCPVAAMRTGPSWTVAATFGLAPEIVVSIDVNGRVLSVVGSPVRYQRTSVPGWKTGSVARGALVKPRGLHEVAEAGVGAAVVAVENLPCLDG